MKKKNAFLRWLPLYLLIFLQLVLFIWEESLPISPISHKLFGSGILIGFFLITNSWISKNEANFIIPLEVLQKDHFGNKKVNETSDHSENKND